MPTHYGQTVETVIRKKGFSISEVARLAHVNRGLIYSWFNQKYLKTEIIYSLGLILKHDFSIEFPELFTKDDFREIYNFKKLETDDLTLEDTTKQEVWKNKYIELLEQYNDLLLTHPLIAEYLNSINQVTNDETQKEHPENDIIC